MFFQSNESDLNLLNGSIWNIFHFGLTVSYQHSRSDATLTTSPGSLESWNTASTLKKWLLYREIKKKRVNKLNGTWNIRPSLPNSATKIRWRRGSPGKMCLNTEHRDQMRYSAQTLHPSHSSSTPFAPGSTALTLPIQLRPWFNQCGGAKGCLHPL